VTFYCRSQWQLTDGDPTMIDTHIHLQHPRYALDRHATLVRAAAAGVDSVIVPGTNPDDSALAVELASRAVPAAPCRIHAAVGIHPTEAFLLDPTVTDALASLAASRHVVAVGEIGLDYYWPSRPDRTWKCADPATQLFAFERQLALASELALPVIIHDRDAHRDTIETVRAWKARDPSASGTFHAYAGGADLLEEILRLGFYIGVDGPVTYRSATDLHDMVRHVPLNRLLIETDGPYLTPVPHRGHRNEPAYLVDIATQVAQLQGIDLRTLAAATTENAETLFGL
jgi:TatD DNase family protein